MADIDFIEMPTTFDRAFVQTLVDTLNALIEGQGEGGGGFTVDNSGILRHKPFEKALLVKLTGGSSGVFTGAEQVQVSGTMQAFTDGRATISTLSEINGWQDVDTSSGYTIAVETMGTSHTTHDYTFQIPIPKPPDRTKDYLLGYDGTAHKMTWVLNSTACS